MENRYYSQAGQDQFVSHLFKHKSTGSFVDVGCWHPSANNNSYYLETLGWKGICLDRDPHDFSQRTAFYFNDDALTVDYKQMFDSCNMPKVIDYLSLDIDVPHTLTALINIINSEYEFKVMTIEHDWYGIEDRLPVRQEMRKILTDKGYHLLCGDVWFQNNEYFEDWWIHPDYFDSKELEYLQVNELSYIEIIDKIKQHGNYKNE